MNFSTFLILVVSALPLATSSPITPRDPENRELDYPDEAVFLLKCTRWQKGQESPNGIKDYLWLNHNADEPEPENYYDYPYDWGLTVGGGHIDWTVGTKEKPIKGKLNNKPFEAWSLDKTGDPKTNVTGHATLDGAPFRCYTTTRPFKQQLTTKPVETWYDCQANYYCTRASRKVRRTKFEFKESTVQASFFLTEEAGNDSEGQIRGYIQEAFRNLTYAYDHKLSAKDSTLTMKDSDTQVQYYIDMAEGEGDANYDPDRVKLVQQYLIDKAAPEIAKTKKFGDCKMAFGSQYATCEYSVEFPAEIFVLSQISDQSPIDWVPKDKIMVVFRHSEEASDRCKDLGAGAKLLAGVFGPAGMYLNGGLSALAKGLGGIFGATGAAVCGKIPGYDFWD
jgi:hypothetical protein